MSIVQYVFFTLVEDLGGRKMQRAKPLVGAGLVFFIEYAHAQHGRFTDELLDDGGAAGGPIATSLLLLFTLLIGGMLFKASPEQRQSAAKLGLGGAFVGFILGIISGFILLMPILGILGFFYGYGAAKSQD